MYSRSICNFVPEDSQCFNEFQQLFCFSIGSDNGIVDDVMKLTPMLFYVKNNDLTTDYRCCIIRRMMTQFTMLLIYVCMNLNGK